MSVTTTSRNPRPSYPTAPGQPVLGSPLAEALPFRASSDDEKQRLLAQGLVRSVIADVLVAVDAPDSRAIRIAATGLLIPTEVRLNLGWVVGFASAAWLHTGGCGTTQSAQEKLQVIISPRQRRPRVPGIRGRQVALAPDQVVFLGGVAVTDPVRTAADVARDLPPAEALAALRRLHELCEVRPHQVIKVLTSMRYARGAATGRRLVHRWEEEG
jgi:hypothetical protein